MDAIVNSRVETVHHVFHAPELWVILQTLGAVAPGLEVPPEVASDPDAVQAAQANLLEQGALLNDAAGRMTLAPQIEALVRPAAYPETVFIANIADDPISGQPARIMCFGWTPEALVVNWVDEANDHHFQSYAPQDVQSCIWDHLSRLCNLEVDDPDPAQAVLTSQDMEKRLGQMNQAVLLMAVNGIQAPEQTACALGWYVSGRYAWLVQKEEESNPLGRGVGRADLELAVLEFVEQGLMSGQPMAD